MPKVDAVMPVAAQGDTEDKPSPTPRINRISDKAAAAAAPAITALHDTALVDAGVSSPASATDARGRDDSLKVEVGVSAMAISAGFGAEMWDQPGRNTIRTPRDHAVGRVRNPAADGVIGRCR